jgi:hypothetical protein
MGRTSAISRIDYFFLTTALKAEVKAPPWLDGRTRVDP